MTPCPTCKRWQQRVDAERDRHMRDLLNKLWQAHIEGEHRHITKQPRAVSKDKARRIYGRMGE